MIERMNSYLEQGGLSRVLEAVKSPGFMGPLEKELYDHIRKMVDDSVTTDIVEINEDELYNFCQYWKEFKPGSEHEKRMTIPGDIIMEGTVPILDMIIRTHTVEETDDTLHHNLFGNSIRDIRVVIFEESFRNIRRVANSINPDDIASIIVGSVVITAEYQFIFPITISYGETCELGIYTNISSFKMTHSQYTNWYKKYMNPDIGTIMLTVIGMVMSGWYGMQLALLHPATEIVFANPVKEKRDRKEQLKPVMVDGKPRRVKYVRKHVITTENNIYSALDSAMDTMSNGDASIDKKKYERHKYLWRVIGHPRKTASGKDTWVKPHWRGPLKDFAKGAKFVENDRVIDIVEEGE